MKIDDLIVGSKYANDDICKAFLCSPQGGMRRSKRTNTLVLISNHIKSIYQDRWLDNKLYYIGMGSLGNQTLKGNQNITLYESSTNGIDVHLFEVYKNKVNTYMGRVQLAEKPFKENKTMLMGIFVKSGFFHCNLLTRESQ